jgi:hypothetical protein
VSLAPGTPLGSYEVIAQIGAGGLGEVFRLHDTKRSDERLLGGLSVEETSQAVGVSIRTAARDHGFARDWLRREMEA